MATLGANIIKLLSHDVSYQLMNNALILQLNLHKYNNIHFLRTQVMIIIVPIRIW